MLLAHISDLHFGSEDPEALAAVAKFVAERRPDAVLATGDLSARGRMSELEAACDWLRALPAPVIVTPGNHDVPYYDVFGRAAYPWTRFRRAAAGLCSQTWRASDIIVAPINTARALQLRLNWAQGAISDAQVAAAAMALRAAPAAALKVVMTHHPLDWPESAPIHGATINGVSAMAKLIEAGADLFLSGHLHAASARMAGNAVSATGGTLSTRLRHEPGGFSVITRPTPNCIEFEFQHIVKGAAQSAERRSFTLKRIP